MSSAQRASKGRSSGRVWAILGAGVLCLSWSGTAAAQTAQNVRPADALHQLNDAVEALVRKVSPSVLVAPMIS